MDAHIGKLEADVHAFDDRTLLSPDVMEVVVREVLARIERDRQSTARHADDVGMWPSVRSKATDS
jgi:hypothetical protein